MYVNLYVNNILTKYKYISSIILKHLQPTLITLDNIIVIGVSLIGSKHLKTLHYKTKLFSIAKTCISNLQNVEASFIHNDS